MIYSLGASDFKWLIKPENRLVPGRFAAIANVCDKPRYAERTFNTYSRMPPKTGRRKNLRKRSSDRPSLIG